MIKEECFMQRNQLATVKNDEAIELALLQKLAERLPNDIDILQALAELYTKNKLILFRSARQKFPFPKSRQASYGILPDQLRSVAYGPELLGSRIEEHSLQA